MNKMPPFLLSAVVLFWGQQTGFWIFAIPAAFIIEAHRFIPGWDFSERDFRRVLYFCIAIAVLVALYAYLTRAPGQALVITVQWLVPAFLPLLAVQRFSTRSMKIDFAYPYAAMTILGASSANTTTIGFYLGTLLLTAYALWRVRPRHAPAVLWIVMIVAAAAIGYLGHVGLHSLQRTVEGQFASLVSGENTANASVKNTAIGSLGLLKLSSRIAFRVYMERTRAPLLLHTATFTSYAASQWVAINARPDALQPGPREGVWEIARGGAKENSIRVEGSLSATSGLIPLPDRTVRIEGFSGSVLRRDRFGGVHVDGGTGSVAYAVSDGAGVSSDTAPESVDVYVHPSIQPLFVRIARELKLDSMTTSEKIQTVAAYFQSNFRYSLYQASRNPDTDPLQRFLTETRSGHCEYFATSTVLLLRTAGVPARYATGYAVQEWSPREGTFIVRDRHAHAWTRVYREGAWEDLDTTPASWANEESSLASFWQPAEDWLSWRWSQLPAGMWKWLLLPAALFALWFAQSLWKRRVRRRSEALPSKRKLEGSDSEFYKIELMLQKAGYGRRPAESANAWLERLSVSGSGGIAIEPLRSLLALHYRYRFDSFGLSLQDRAKLKFLAESWIAQHRHLRAGNVLRHIRSRLG